jgi:tellurite resistance protein
MNPPGRRSQVGAPGTDDDVIMSDARAQAKAKLAQLVQRVMADGKIEPSEREELQSVYRQALLTVSDIKDVLTQYLAGVRAEVLADGIVTAEERERCRAVVAALKIPPPLVPADFQAILNA